MASEIPAAFTDLLEKRAFGHLATLMPDGAPQTTPVWVDREGDLVVVNTTDDRQKFENLERDPRVAISIHDPDNPYRYLEVRGRVTEKTRDGADTHIDQLAKRYLGEDRYPWAQEGETRVKIKIRPEHTTERA